MPKTIIIVIGMVFCCALAFPAAAKESVHLPYAERMCDSCHGMEDKAETCLDCHDQAQAEKHPKNDMVTCISCHYPHKADLPFLLRETLDGGKLCENCHAIDN